MSATMDYSKMKNAELEALLKERSLPHTGKKAEMVSRLTEHDKTSGQAQPSTTVPASASTAPSAPTDASNGTEKTPAPTTATSEPAAAAIAAGGTTRVANPVAVPNQEVGEDPAESNDLTVSKDTTTSTSAPLSGETSAPEALPTREEVKAKDAALFTSNMPATDLDAELAKRKARAKKFGIEESDSDAIRAIERAKRFGTGTAGEQAAGTSTGPIKGLDEALPERRAKKHPRERTGEDGDDAGTKRRRGGAGVRGRGGMQRQRSEKSVPQADGSGASWMSEKDREAAERRKAKFGQA